MLPWLRGVPAEAFFSNDGAVTPSLEGAEANREMARAGSPDPTVDADGFTFRSYVEEVRVSFSVVGRDGHPVFGVGQQDLEIYENAVPVQHITAFEHNEETPRRFAVLLDSSGSVQGEFASLQQTVVEMLAGTVRSGKDEAMIASFGGRGLKVVTPFTDSMDAMRSAMLPVEAVGPTALYDSVVEVTANKYWISAGKPRAQRVILLVTDGEDTLSFHTLEDAIRAVSSTSYYVYAVVVPPSCASKKKRKKPEAFSKHGMEILQQLTKATGGRVFEMRDRSDFNTVLQTINDDLRAQYSVAYRRPTASRGSGFREIAIITSDHDWVVRSRPGYIARERD